MSERRQTIELLAGSGITAALTMVYIVYVARVVGPAEYADFSAALSAIYLVGMAVTPLTPIVARVTAQHVARGEDGAVPPMRRVALLRVAAIVGAAVLIGIVTAIPIGRALHFRTPAPLMIAFISILLFALVNVDRGVAQGLQLFRAYNANVVIEVSCRVALGVVLLAVTPSAAAALTGYAAALLIAEVMIALRLRPGVRTAERAPDWSGVRSLMTAMIILMLCLAAFQNADMFAVKRWFAAEDAGAYAAASVLARGIGVIFVPFYVLIGPRLTTLYEQGKPLHGAALRLVRGFVLIAGSAVAILAALRGPLLRTIYGNEFAKGGEVVAPLAAVATLTYTGILLVQVFITRRQYKFLWAYGAFAVMQVVALVAFHRTLREVVGAMLVTQGAMLLVTMTLFVRSWRRPGEVSVSIPRERISADQGMAPWLHHQHVSRYEWAAAFCRDARVLDAACANGYGSRSLGVSGSRYVLGVDIATEPLIESRAFERVPRVWLLAGDATQLPFRDANFDTFISFETIEHIPDDDAYLREVRRVLAAGGAFVCSTPNRRLVNAGNSIEDRPFNPFHVREYSREELDGRLRGHFATIEWFGQSRYGITYTNALAAVGRVSHYAAVRLHQIRKVAGIPLESQRRHLPYRLTGEDEPEVLIAVCR